MARAEMVAARQRFFGTDIVEPDTGAVRADRVVLSWLGCTTFAAALAGQVFLFDAWVPRGLHSGYVPTTPAEVADIAPAAIFIGHGHFDHAADAAELAGRSGAAVYGTAEHCAQIRRKSVSDVSGVAWVELGDSTSRPGECHRRELACGIELTAVRHLHSAPTRRRRGPDSSPRLLPAPALRDVLAYPPTAKDAAGLAASLGDREGGSLLYQFRVGEFTLTWHDSTGPLSERAPHVLDVLRALPRTDVQVGAIQGFNQIGNGLRDPRSYIEALRPSVFVPCHHDNWLPIMTSRGAKYRDPLRAELDRIPERARPRLRFLADPADYLRPSTLTFSL